ncbi:uncharacterized protein LOC112346102 [Selaginella moellendorffii]|nr:uncharacterized protein LOC112346102 [Selaginella moellendorffii]|eukprot:XP_024529965.1 uncharacterized protein LOC112346102 [Selaginella moellendorffii]
MITVNSKQQQQPVAAGVMDREHDHDQRDRDQMEDDNVMGSVNSSSVEDQSSVKSESLSPPCPNSKIKIMCSYGGRILPRPHDGQLRYVGGETRILLWQRSISFGEMMAKLVAMVGRSVAVKYQLPNEDLDALISVVCEEDFGSMIDEYLRMEGRDSSARLRLFLFFIPAPTPPSSSSPRLSESRSLDQQFIEALNGMPVASGGNSGAAPRPSRALDEDLECGRPVKPIKMHRQLSATDRIAETASGSPSSRRVSPRTSPRAPDECPSVRSARSSLLQQQLQDSLHEPCKQLAVATRENSAGRIPQEMIEPVMIHHYYPGTDPCSRQVFSNEPPTPPDMSKVAHHEGESPKKADQHSQDLQAANGFICVSTTWCAGSEILVNRQYSPAAVHHRHGHPIAPAICDQQLYPVMASATACCSCRETRTSKPGPSPSRFRDGLQQQQQPQQQIFHEQVDDNTRMLLRPVLVPQQQHQQQQPFYEPVHHHHRLVAEKNGSRLSDLDRSKYKR